MPYFLFYLLGQINILCFVIWKCIISCVWRDQSIFVAVVFDGESFHIFEGDFAFVVAIEDAVVAGDVGGGGVEFFVHGAVEIHKHFTCGDGFKDSVFVVVIHVE
mgnify:CR=1 FL=1